ncbi:hypothetical protein COY28_06845 [Candidatus Woesearchaeota archaeon CG_4_10_14_0_2_um_filter_57_5]|nr:MAG: hypothetical protein AUJ68_03845 [Candidatus Woesearchaeota archaeon CG1_02_57_44]PIN69893.1 MAG: hypothetical protein COV94_02350 [Candidatus Woesearchaeota archaeon CG11_big_fil_rev_8_21_14_0_20_57_5]PIZ48866.1 MAG: hypothetical protein COY28_06845 [Candidatus Woesearchaeota archaeon CG_4_10_14_0_2_um_filter_57_5]
MTSQTSSKSSASADIAILYQDEKAVVRGTNHAAAIGQVTITPPTDTGKGADLPREDIIHIYTIANLAATALFETLGAGGTNIIATDAALAETFSVTVLPRKEGDGLDFRWPPKQLPPEDMDEAQKKIKSECLLIGKKRVVSAPKPPATTAATAPSVAEEQVPDEAPGGIQRMRSPDDNYLMRQLNRIP